MSSATEAQRVGSLVGQVIDGRYRVDSVIALGGMGAVLRGTHLVLGQAVAIKVMLDATMHDPRMRERVFREARILAQVRSPAIAAIFDAGLLPDGTLFIVMELLEGDELETLIVKRALGLPQLARLLCQVCEGLADAHAQGVVHRDLKPANIFVVKKLSGELSAKIIDFGISKRVGEVNETTTVTTIIGSPYYMAPEQANSSRDVDHRADIWSLGVILYRVVVGKLPFEGTVSAVLAGIRTKEPSFPEGIDPGFRHIIHRCLEKDLSRRYASALEVQAALLPLAEPPRRASAATHRASTSPGPDVAQRDMRDPRASADATENPTLQLGLTGPSVAIACAPMVRYSDDNETVTARMASPLSASGATPVSAIVPLAGRRDGRFARTMPLAPPAAASPAGLAPGHASVGSPRAAPTAKTTPLAPPRVFPSGLPASPRASTPAPPARRRASLPPPAFTRVSAPAPPPARKSAWFVWLLVGLVALVALAAIASRVRREPGSPAAEPSGAASAN